MVPSPVIDPPGTDLRIFAARFEKLTLSRRIVMKRNPARTSETKTNQENALRLHTYVAGGFMWSPEAVTARYAGRIASRDQISLGCPDRPEERH